jgi:phage shock protein A
MIKTKKAVAKTQKTLNKATDSIDSTKGDMSSFERMEEKADKMLDQANAMSELNMKPIDEAKALEEKYASQGSASVEDELEKMKKDIGL